MFLLTAIYALNVADQYLVPTVFPLLKQEFGLSDSALGLLSGSYVIVVMVMSVPFGYLADRFHRTRIISWGTAAWGATMILTGARVELRQPVRRAHGARRVGSVRQPDL